MNRPVFVAGCMRSGTTLLMMLIDSGRTIAGPPSESYFMANFYGSQARAEGSDLPEPKDCLAQIARLSHEQYAPICESPSVKEKMQGVTTYAEAFDVVSTELARSLGKERWSDKTPGNEFFAWDILQLFPTSRIIYVLRDYRDVVASKMQKECEAGAGDEAAAREAAHGAHLWKASVEAHLWNVHHLPRDRYATILYEELVTRPKETLGSLAEILGEDLSELVEEREGRTFYRPAEERSYYLHRGRPNSAEAKAELSSYEISTRSVGRYATVVKPEQLKEIAKICAPYPMALGYGDADGKTSWQTFGERERVYASKLTRKAKFWFGQKERRLTAGS